MWNGVLMFILLFGLSFVALVLGFRWVALRYILPHRYLIPELGFFQPKARARVLSGVMSSFHGHAWIAAIWGGCTLFAFAFGRPWGRSIAHALTSLLYVGLTASLLPLLVSFAVVYWIFKDRIRRALREQLADSPSFSLCVNCGYDLRGSKDRCPECGTEFERHA